MERESTSWVKLPAFFLLVNGIVIPYYEQCSGLNIEEHGVKRTEGAQAIGRATEILRVVARLQQGGATLGNVCRATNFNRSTAFRILRSLTEERLLAFDPDGHRYAIGPLAYELGLAARGQNDVIALWREQLERIAVRTGLTTYLVIRSDSEVACLAMAHTNVVIRAVPLTVGQRLPLGVGAGSLAILSSLDDDEVESILAANSHKYAVSGGRQITPAVLRKRIELTRQAGYAFSQDTVATGVVGVGLVVSKPDDLTQLAVSVSMPAATLEAGEQQRLATAIREIALPGARKAAQ